MNLQDSNRRLELLSARLDQLAAGVNPADVVDNELANAIVDWLGPLEDVPPELLQNALAEVRAAQAERIASTSTLGNESRTGNDLLESTRSASEPPAMGERRARWG